MEPSRPAGFGFCCLFIYFLSPHLTLFSRLTWHGMGNSRLTLLVPIPALSPLCRLNYLICNISSPSLSSLSEHPDRLK